MRRLITTMLGFAALLEMPFSSELESQGVAPATQVAGVTAEQPREPVRIVRHFAYSGEREIFVPPADVTQIDVVMCGAPGADLVVPNGVGAGGLGAEVSASVEVRPNWVVGVRVGGVGEARQGGFNGGGTDIRLMGDDLNDRVVVAGGGFRGGDSGEFVHSVLSFSSFPVRGGRVLEMRSPLVSVRATVGWRSSTRRSRLPRSDRTA